jgi:hypothetical protein
MKMAVLLLLHAAVLMVLMASRQTMPVPATCSATVAASPKTNRSTAD